MQKAKGKLFSLLLVFVMALILSPATVFAADTVLDTENEAEIVGKQEYPTVEEAITAAEAGDVVKLLKDVEVEDLIQINNAITLDLNGKTFKSTVDGSSTVESFALWIRNDVTVQNGTIDMPNESTQAAIYDSVHLTIGPNLVINTPNVGVIVKEGSAPGKLTVRAGGSLKCTGSYIDPSGKTIPVTAVLTDKNNTVMEIYGTVESESSALQTNGTNEGNIINIYEGAKVKSETLGIYFPSDGQLNIQGGEITGGITGIEIRAGELNMTGGTVQGNTNGKYPPVIDSTGNGSGSTTNGADIAVAKHTTDHDLTVNISGGSLAGTTSVYESKPQGAGTGPGTIAVSITGGEFNGKIFSADCTEFISGGTFAQDPADYVKPDTSFVKNASTYAVGTQAEDLVKNAQSGDTLTIFKYDSEINISEGKEITIENNTGNVIKVNGADLADSQAVTPHIIEATSAKEASCTSAGNIAYWYCSVCDKYYSDEACTQEITKEQTVIAPKGHGETELKNAKEATCTAEGYSGDKVCKDCGVTVEAGNAIAKTAHSFNDGKCTVCSAADPNYKPAPRPAQNTAPSGSNIVKTYKKSATCTSAGNITYWYCTANGKYYRDEACTQEIAKKDTVIAAKGHGETEIKNAKEATCAEEGYTGDKVCKICGEVIEKGKVIEKTAHEYKDGKCSLCGIQDPDYEGNSQPVDAENTSGDAKKSEGSFALWPILIVLLIILFIIIFFKRKKKSDE